MFTQALRHMSVYGSARLASAFMALLALPFYARWLTPKDLGVLDLLMLMTVFVNLTASLEITQGLARLYPDASDEDSKSSYVSTGLWFVVFTSALFTLMVFSMSDWLEPWLVGSDASRSVFPVGVATTVTSGLFLFSSRQLRWQLKPHQFATAQFVQTISLHVVGTLLLVVYSFGLTGILLGQVFGNTVGLATSLWYARRSIRLTFDKKKLREMLSFSLPLVPSSIGVFVAVYLDRIAIRELMTFDDVGLYSVAIRLASPVVIIMAAIELAWTPLVYSHYQDAETPAQIARIFRYFVSGMLVLLLGLAAYSREMIGIFATPQYASVANLVPILAVGLLIGRAYIFAPGLAIAKRTRSIASINIGAGVLNTLLNFSLIPFLGLSGAALATLISAFSAFICYFNAGQKYYSVPYEWALICRGIIVATIFMLTIILFDQFVEASWVINLVSKSVLLAIAVPATICLVIESSELSELSSSIKGRFQCGNGGS